MELFTLLMLAMCPLGIMCQFNMTAYRQMPPLFQLEDYDLCLANPKPSSYCVVIGEIVPNTTSRLWNQIANFSSVVKRHFRHDVLHFGICLDHCKQLVNSLSQVQQDELYTGKIQYTEVTEFFDDVNRRTANARLQNEKLLNICLNYKFKDQYSLELRSYTQYCASNDKPPNFDFSEIVLMIIIATILCLVILSSNYDRLLKTKQPITLQGIQFYQERLHSPRDAVMTSFSLYRNYYRLTAQPSNDFARNFKFFETFRFFSMVMVLFAHVLITLKSVPVKNTEFIEKVFYKFGANLFINGTVIIQIFFVMSSFLLTLNFQRSLAFKKYEFADWGKLILYRYLRIAPCLAFVILLNASILPRLQDGPFWKFLTDSEYTLCRETWWRNLLFINNFTLKKSCLHQTWYVATDFQLYIILTGILIIIAKFPKTKTYILGAGVIISFLTTGMVTYFLELNGVHQETPNSYRFLFWTDGDTLYQGYAPFYMNFGGFIFGTITALLYLKYKEEGLNLKGKRGKLNIIVCCMVPLPFLVLLSGDIFYEFQFTKPSIWIGIFAGLHRNVWALMCCAVVLAMAFKVGSIAYRFSSMRMFAPLGRLSFQVYLIHTIIIRCIGGSVRVPTHSNGLILAMHIITCMMISFFLAFFLYLFLELPLTTLVNIVVKGKVKPTKSLASSEMNGTHINKEETTAA